MQIKIVCFGVLDKNFYKQAFEHYAKKIAKSASIEVIELKEEINKEINTNKKVNSDLLINKINQLVDFEVICLNVKSKQISSEKFSEIIMENKNFKKAKLVFVIGPSDGFSDSFLKQSFRQVSFGEITLPHQLFRVVLVEQIYRGFKIINNEKYHK